MYDGWLAEGEHLLRKGQHESSYLYKPPVKFLKMSQGLIENLQYSW